MASTNRFNSINHPVPKNVLILDDNVSILKMLHKLLEKLGYNVEYAETGEILIEMYKEAQIAGKKYDFLILDIVIPDGMSGDETLKEILRIDPSVKAIVSSGYSSNPVMSDFEHYGFAGVLAKPYTVGELKKAIADIGES